MHVACIVKTSYSKRWEVNSDKISRQLYSKQPEDLQILYHSLALQEKLC